MAAFYNEIDEYAAQWLRNLIAAGHIADGVVDTRSIIEIEPYDLVDFDQCHFFAGIGVWSYALRAAGWPDDRQVWTGSCPCQPFSVAGAGAGFDDERHLWPHWHHLIRELHPRVVFGEQVASRDGLGWLDLVHADLEGEGYAVGAFDICAAGVGAPHIRQRLWFTAERMANARRERDERVRGPGEAHGAAREAQGEARERERGGPAAGAGSTLGGVGHHHHQGLEGRCDGHYAEVGREGAVRPVAEAGEPRRLADDDDDGFAQQRLGGLLDGERPALGHDADGRGAVCGVADAQARGRGVVGGALGSGDVRHADGSGDELGRLADAESKGSSHRRAGGSFTEFAEVGGGSCGTVRTGPTHGYWRDADWLGCRDGKWRPVSALPQPLVDGSSESLGRVRAQVVQEVENEIDAATAQTEGGRPAAMRALLDHLGAQAKWCWPAGRIPGLHEAPLLLAFLRQLQAQGWRLAEGVALSRSEASSGLLRSVWHDQAAAGASRQRGLGEQRADEYPDVVRVLSRLLARHASEAWGDAYAAYAETKHPLAQKAVSRVGRLRAYGNAIVAPVAAEVIRAFMECRP